MTAISGSMARRDQTRSTDRNRRQRCRMSGSGLRCGRPWRAINRRRARISGPAEKSRLRDTRWGGKNMECTAIIEHSGEAINNRMARIIGRDFGVRPVK